MFKKIINVKPLFLFPCCQENLIIFDLNLIDKIINVFITVPSDQCLPDIALTVCKLLYQGMLKHFLFQELTFIPTCFSNLDFIS